MTCAISTMPMFTITPIRIMMPSIAMNDTGVWLIASPQNTPTMAKMIDVMIDTG
ncbi:hypothetical protein D3C83_202830 [compost metagenome]